MRMHRVWSRLRFGLGVLALLGAFGSPLLAQSDMATGTLQGWVTDTEGAVLPGVTVTASNRETGFARSQQTDSDGRFHIRLLPPSTYTLGVKLDGFAPYQQQGIRVQIGDVSTLRIRLELATVIDQVTVTGEAPLVETARPSITTTVSSEWVEAMPINGRNFSELVALMTPQAVPGGFGRLSIAGDEGMHNSFNVDGADANSGFFGEPLGGALPPFTYSQSAVQEFQVLRASYNVRFGGASGGIVNMVTKSGTNIYHGGVVASFQDDSFTTTDALGVEQNDFERLQAGFNLGGPISRDKAHFFVAYEGQRKDENNRGEPIGLPPELEPAFNAKLASLGIDPRTEYDFVGTNDVDVLLVRLDWTVSDQHLLWFRNNWMDQRGENRTFAFLTAGKSNRGTAANSFNSSVLTLNSVLGRRSFNEAIVQYVPSSRPNTANHLATPQTSISFFDAVIGQSFILPNDLDDARLQLQDNFTLQQGGHTLRFGVDYSYIDFDNFFLFNRGGFHLVPSYEEFVKEQPCVEFNGFLPCFYQQSFSPTEGRLSYETHLLSLYAGDEWAASPSLTLEYGLRLDYQNNPSAQNPNPLEPRTANIPDDTNLAPRIGFAWDVRGDGRSVLRGGAGIFYSWTATLVPATSILNNGVNSTSVFLTQFSPFFPGYPNRLPPEFGELGLQPPDINLMDPDFENPETYRFSLGYDQAVGSDWRLGAELTYSESKHRVRMWDVNLDPTPVGLTPDGRPIYGVNNPFPNQARLDPNFNQKLQFTSDVEAEYFAVVLTAFKRLSRNWMFDANYTYARLKDHDTAETDLFAIFPEDHYNLEQDWGWSNSDVRHQAVTSGTYSAPYGFTFSFLGRYLSGYPYTGFAESDLNHDNFFYDRPGPDPNLGLDSHLDRNSFRTDGFFTLDLRLAKSFHLTGPNQIQLIVDVFNVTNHDNFPAVDTNFTRLGELNPDFGAPLVAGLPRTWQVTVRYSF